MILSSICNSCFSVFNLHLKDDDVALLKELRGEDGMCPCPRLCGGRINLGYSESLDAMAKDPRLKEPLSLDAKELFKAVNGAGLPDEIPKTVETVIALLIAHRFTAVDAEERNGKIFLHSITMENGVTVHLTTGLHGAQVLKVTKGSR